MFSGACVSDFKKILKKLDNYDRKSTRYVKFCVDKSLVGMVRDDFVPIWLELGRPGNIIFNSEKNELSFSKGISSVEDRTNVLQDILTQWKYKYSNEALDGWRNEHFSIQDFNESPLIDNSKVHFTLERAACPLLGAHAFGTHLNGYVKNTETNKITHMWIAKRSLRKPNSPGLLDNVAAGGLPAYMLPRENMIKEALEEANIDQRLAQGIKSVGTISYKAEKSKGLSNETQFVFDLQLPKKFIPNANDGEVEGFQLLTIEEVVKQICLGNMKPNSAMVVIHFLVRHSLIDKKDPDYDSIVKLLNDESLCA